MASNFAPKKYKRMKVEKFKVLLYLKKSGLASRAKPDNGKNYSEPHDGTVRMQVVLHSRIVESPVKAV